MLWLTHACCCASIIWLVLPCATIGQEAHADWPGEQSELHSRQRRDAAYKYRSFKRDPKDRFPFTRVNVGINQQTRFLTKYGPYIVKLHLLLDKGVEKGTKGREDMLKIAKEVVNYANTLLRPFNTYIMVTSMQEASGKRSVLENKGHDNGAIMRHIQNKYIYFNYAYMFDEVINCVFVFMGRNHLNFSMSDSSGKPCDQYLSHPSCLGYVTLETDRPNYAKIAGFSLAHELGHRLGGNHDTGEKCRCHFDHCLMNEYLGSIDGDTKSVGWSACSIDSVASSLDSLALGKGCLSIKWNSSTQTDGLSISAEYSTDWGASCGNGILEPGEQCDCGGPLACSNNRCCKGDVCQLADGAACGTGDCCNMTTCMPMGNGTICRLAEDPRCDFPEFCNGVLPTCPPDVSVLNDWPCDPASDHRCRLRHCLPPQRNAKYVGPQCDAKTHVPATTKECKLMHVAKPAEILEEFVDEVLGREDDDMSVNGTVGKEDPAYKHSVDLETADQDARQLRGIIWLVAASTTLLAALMAS